MAMLEEHAQGHLVRSILIGGIVLVLMLVVGFFVWRVTYYAKLIRTGDIVFSDLSFLEDASYSNSLLVKPIPDGEFSVSTADDPSLGDTKATIEIVEFADFGCPFSKSSAYNLRRLALEFGDKVHVVFRDFPLVELHPGADLAAEAGECAHAQGMFWNYHDRLFVQQNDLSYENLVKIARDTALNIPVFENCLSSHQYKDEVQADFEAGVEAGVQGTPTFFINGNRIPGSIPEDVFRKLIEKILVDNVAS